ncbi:hypothetical protein QJQ45_001004 [Haematococcus lacustris]|nr:hypothetical protein QJQ45_001004 [Haematococcus lacustris]
MNKVSSSSSQPGRIKAVFGAQCQWLWLGHCTGAEHDGGADHGRRYSAGTSLEANLKHVTVTLATWDVVWVVYLDPKWARQRRRLEQLFEKLEEGMAEVSMERHERVQQLVVFFGMAGIGTRGGWGADAVLRACCKVVCRPRGTDQQRGREILVDEFRTSRVSSAVNGRQVSKRSKRTMVVQAAETTQPNKGTGKGKGNAAKAKPKPQPGNWLDRDCNAALTMQRMGESRWRPLELCWWPDQAALPAKGREYPGLGYKQLQDKPPKASSSN